MEGLELDVATVVSEHVHHELEVVSMADVFGHDSEVVPVEQQFSQKLE